MDRERLSRLAIIPPDEKIYREIRGRIDAIAKPLDGLGEFERLLARIGAIHGDVSLDIEKKAVVVLCADNGIVEERVSQSGPEVTAKVAALMGQNKSAVCRMASAAGAEVFPVDIGIRDAAALPGVLDCKVARGTKNFLRERAMTEEEALRAVETGMEFVRRFREEGVRLLATGEMGIGNTTTSCAVASALLGLDPAQLAGRGAGLSGEGLSHKTEVIRQGIALHGLTAQTDVVDVLCAVGGLDIAGLAGVFLGGAVYRMPVVVDGVISAAAALAAERLAAGVREYLIPSHVSREPAARLILRELGLAPVIDAGLALGEGTGAVMMLALLDCARAVYAVRTTFSELDMEPYRRMT